MKKSVSFVCISLVLLSSLASFGTINGEVVLEEEEFSLFINLKAAKFDPLLTNPKVPSYLTYHDENNYYLVQCKGPIQWEWVQTLFDLDVEILGYIPDYTYLIYMEKGMKKSIEGVPFIRWIGIYHPAYKIEQNLLSKQGQIQLNVMVFQENAGLNNVKLARDKISTLGGSIFYYGNDNYIIQAEIDASKIKDIAFIPEVEWIEEYSPPKALMDNIRIFTGAESPLHEYGFNGTGIVGEVKDNGVDQNHPEFEGQLLATDGSVSEESHGTSTFGIVFAKGVNDQAKGMLPGAKGVFADWSVGRKQSIANLVNNWGGVFQSNSWHTGATDGAYGSNTRQNDEAVFEYDVTMLYASGNGGNDETITREAAAKNVIGVGALNHYNNVDRTDDLHNGNQGNKGPTDDGRIKPDVVGLYDSIYTTTSGDGYTSGFGGTSGAAPVAAGAVGLIYDMYKENHFGNNPTGALPHAATVKAIMIADAYQYEFSQGDRFAQGWGLVDVGNVYHIGENHLIDDESVSLKTGQSTLYNIIPTGIQPFKISLVWTDVPGTTSSSQHLVNDLTLKVRDPDGTIYYGNVGLETSKWSSSGGNVDNLNNVENVFIENPVAGKWTIEVIADNIALDGNTDTTEVDQKFALVASGVIQVDHDMVVSDMEELPRFFALHEEAVVNSTISNLGLMDETHVIINLMDNEVIIDTHTITSIQSGTSMQISMSWIPTIEKTSDISIKILPVNGEDRLFNNQMTKSVDLFTPLGLVLVDEAHGNGENFFSYFEQLYSIKFPVSFINTTITQSLLVQYDVLITARATSDYTSVELSAIESFVSNGGGLFVIGDDEPSIYNELTTYAGIIWNTPRGIGGTLTDIVPHNITEGVDELYLDSPNLVLEVSSPAQEIVYDNGVMISRPLVATSEYVSGKIVALADDNCLDNDNIDSSDNRLFGENVIKWLDKNHAPIAIIDSPIDGDNYSSIYPIQFNGSSSFDPDGYIIDHTWISNKDGTFGSGVVFNAQLSAGDHIITLKVTDNEGKTTLAAITLIITSPIMPKVTIESPNDGNIVNGIITISGSASDIDGIIEIVEVRIGNGNWTQATGTENWNFEFDTTFYLDGGIKVQVRSTDNEFQYSDIFSITVTIDNTPPIIITAPKASSITDTSAKIEWETNEPGDSIVEYWIDNPNENLSESDASYATYHRVVLNDLSPSTTYHFIVKSKDEVGNGYTISEDRTFITNLPPDTTAPEVVITNPKNGDILKGEVLITVDASDDYGIANVEFYIDDKYKFVDQTPNYSWLWDTTDGHYPDGQYSVKIVVKDMSGNAESSEIIVILDNEVIIPTIGKKMATPNSIVSGKSTDVLFTVKVSDPENLVESMVIDLSPIDGSSHQNMYDDGSHGDEDAGDHVYSFKATVPSDVVEGDKSIAITVTYNEGGTIESSITLYVISQDQDGTSDDGSSDEQGMFWLLLLMLLVLVAVVLGVVAVARKKPRSKNEVVVVPLYQPGYYQDQTGYYHNQTNYYRQEYHR
jgi:hypothetical protein